MADEVAGLRRELVGAQALLALFRQQTQLSAQRISELQADNTQLAQDNAQLLQDIARLREGLEQARRAGKRQAAPFSRGQKKTDPATPGRKPGEAYGQKARRLPPAPEQVDEQVEVGLPDCCPHCQGEVIFDEVTEQFQEEVVPAHTRVRRYEIAPGHCADCRRRVRSRHPDQTWGATGAAGVMLGPLAHALAAWLRVGLGVPMGKVAMILNRLCGLSVTAGGLHSALHKTAGDAESTYQALLEALRNSAAVAADETGWRVDAERAWLWAFVGDLVTVYDIAEGRGFDQAAAILGEDFDGVLEVTAGRPTASSPRPTTKRVPPTCYDDAVK